jgi:hypothetical protein
MSQRTAARYRPEEWKEMDLQVWRPSKELITSVRTHPRVSPGLAKSLFILLSDVPPAPVERNWFSVN